MATYPLPAGTRSLTAVGTTLYVAAGEDGLLILDVGDPANPRAVRILGPSQPGSPREIGSYEVPGALEVTVANPNLYLSASPLSRDPSAGPGPGPPPPPPPAPARGVVPVVVDMGDVPLGQPIRQ